MSFTLALPRLSISGENAVRDMVAMLAQHGTRRALVLTDRIVGGLGGAKMLTKALQDAGIAFETFDRIEPNPTTATVSAAFDVFRRLSPDAIIALGGGSVIDTAKSVRILSANPGPIGRYEGVHHELKAGCLLAAVNTTSGTAAEVTSNAVITDTDRQVKMVIISHSTIPDIAVNDPEVLKSVPPATTAATGMDALTHAIEAYVAKGAHTLTDHSALEAIRIIARWLPAAYRDGADLQAREMMAHGQFLAGMAFNSAGLGCVHSLAHQPGATHNLPHGVCNAVLLPVVEAWNRDAVPDRFARIAEAMGVDVRNLNAEQASLAAITAIKDLSRTVDIPASLGKLGIVAGDIDRWIEPALRDPCTPGNPKEPDARIVKELYLAAL